MKRLLFFILSLASASLYAQASWSEDEPQIIKEMYDNALTEQKAYTWLKELCNGIGPRPSGSQNYQAATEWAVRTLKEMGMDSVWTQEVEVPVWIRGKEEATIKEYIKSYSLAVTALGGSVGTPEEGITAEVVEVQNFAELEALGREKVEGKVVFFNRPMDPTLINTGSAYGGAGNQRWAGALEASKYGAVASINRSLTLKADNYPHTGSMSYRDAEVKIPAAAISIQSAEFLSAKMKENSNLQLQLVLTCRSEGTDIDHNVIAQKNGTEKPEEIVVMGGHLDSWDLGTGAQDDGAGCVQSMEAMRLLLGMDRPLKRSHRVVLFANEEFGLGGAKAYAKQVKESGEYHAIAIESDGGCGTPRGFSVQSVQTGVDYVWGFEELLKPYGLSQFAKGWSGADIGQLKSDQTVLIGYMPDSQRYFDYHHAYTDRVESVNARELELGAAGMAALLYLMDKYPLNLRP